MCPAHAFFLWIFSLSSQVVWFVLHRAFVSTDHRQEHSFLQSNKGAQDLRRAFLSLFEP